MRFAFILEEKAHFPVRCLCTVLEVTRSGFYAWCARPVAARTHDTQRLAVEVAAIHAASKQRYGRPPPSGVAVEARNTVIAVRSGWLTLVGGIGPRVLVTRTAARGQQRLGC